MASIEVKDLGEWASVISTLRSARNAMEEAGDAMKNVIYNSLLQQGIKGDLATKIMDAYEGDVLVSMNQFIDLVDDFISRSEKSRTAVVEGKEKLSNVVKAMM